jgi:arylsulfatase A
MKKNPLVLVSACISLSVSAGDRTEKTKLPNILFILADDMGWSDLPVYGNKFNETPNITKLANEGIRFTNAYAAAPVSSPTRASIMSGQYPARVGINDFIPGHWRPFEEVTVPTNRTQYLPTDIFTMGEAFKKAGYATGYFGKWHLGSMPEHHPLKRGFDEANVGQGYYNTQFDPPRLQSSEKVISDRLADFGIDFIEKNKEKPFFLYLANWAVHCPFDADPAIINKYLAKERSDGYPCNAIYAAMIEQMDKSIGRVMDKLSSAGLSENTIVIFYSDNGGIISENQYPDVEEERMSMLVPSKRYIYKDSPLQYIATSNAPLRSEKGTLYEGGIREPLIVKWPGKIKKGTISKAIVSSIDFYPTFLELTETKKSTSQILDGVSMLPALLRNESDPERSIFWHYPVYHHDVPSGAIRKGDWKLIENQVTGDVVLFNLRADLSESTNLSKVFPEKTKELYSLLKEWQKDVKAEFPKPNPDFNKEKRYLWIKHP